MWSTGPVRWSVESTVVWPSTKRWRELFDEARAELPGGQPPVHLVAGQWWQPGSEYALILPQAPGVQAAGELSGVGVLEFRATLPADPWGAATLRYDTRHPGRLATESTLRHLRWSVGVDLDASRVATGRAVLDWVEARFKVLRVADRVSLQVAVRGRGRWRPVVAFLLGRFGGRADTEAELQRSLDEICASITDLASADSGQALLGITEATRARRRESARAELDDELRRLREGLGVIELQLGWAIAENERQPWSRRGRRGFADTCAALAPRARPQPPRAMRGWGVTEQQLIDVLSRTRARRRPEVLRQELIALQDRWEAKIKAPFAADLGEGRAQGAEEPWWPTATDADFDLAFLRSPIAMMRRFART